MKFSKILLYIVSIGALVISIFIFEGFGKTTLVSNRTGSTQFGDFTLHIRVEEENHEVKVFRSIQYRGEKPVEIKHQTPLISVSLGKKNHDFTGSTLKKTLNPGNSYYPQSARIMKVPEKAGVYTLYCLAEFELDGKIEKIEYSEKLTFE
ncbi:hypothetical protein [Virgibacillus sp. DJP39]|uniref:hypothetical protein n=1 Tax=Virgibacillus sp. DJP39 TaxID=3409790 RepID=UPI003BB73CE6